MSDFDTASESPNIGPVTRVQVLYSGKEELKRKRHVRVVIKLIKVLIEWSGLRITCSVYKH